MATDAAPRQRTRADVVGWAILVIAFVVAVGGPLIGQGRLFAGDVVLQYPPWSEDFVEDPATTAPLSDFVDTQFGNTEQVRSRLLDGDFPEWSPLVAGGSNLTVKTTPLYHPATWISFVVGSPTSPAWVRLFTFLLSATGMFAFCRRLGLASSAALTAAAAFSFSGFEVVWSTWSQPLTGAMIPWLFWGAEGVYRQPGLRRVLPLAGAAALLVASGFPSVAVYGLYALAGTLALRTAIVAFRHRRIDLAGTTAAAGRVATGVGLGVGAVAALVVPFYLELSDSTLPGRSDYADLVYDVRLLATYAFPNALGKLNGEPIYFGPLNQIEGIGYVGVAVLLLALFGVVTAFWTKRHRILTVTFGAAIAAVSAAMYTDTIVHDVAGALPGMAGNPLGRLRVISAFSIAVLAAIGVDALGRRPPMGAAALTIGVAAAPGLFLVRWMRQVAASEGQLSELWPWALVGLAAGAITAIALVAAVRAPRRWGSRVGPVLGIGLLVLVTAEGLFFVRPYLPRVPNELAVPRTETHEFLQEEMDDQGRYLSDQLTLFPGTNRYFGIASLTGHGFHRPEMKEYLEALDPGAFRASPTFSMVGVSSARRSTPLLDRAAVRYLVTSLDAPVIGRRLTARRLGESGDDPVRLGTAALRGVRVEVAGPERTLDGESEADLVVTVHTDTGVRRSERRVPLPLRGFHEVAVLAPGATEISSVDAALHRVGSDEVAASVAGSWAPIISERDGLQLVHVSGTAIWERADALPRFRWAPDALVIADPDRRLATLAAGDVPTDTVVLHEPVDAGNTDDALHGGPGRVVDLDTDDPDRVRVTVDSDEGGWLVIADAIQSGWTARVDGAAAALVPADHAFAAVRVPAGTHRVVLEFAPDGARIGRWLSAVSVTILIGIGIVTRRRRQPASSTSRS